MFPSYTFKELIVEINKEIPEEFLSSIEPRLTVYNDMFGIVLISGNIKKIT